MGLILDSSVVIAAERRGETVERLIERVVSVAGDQDAALSAVGLTELIHGVYRAQTPEMRVRRETFLQELLADVTVYPYTKETRHAGGQDRRRAAKSGCSNPVRRLADRRDSTVPRVFNADGESPTLSENPRSHCFANLAEERHRQRPHSLKAKTQRVRHSRKAARLRRRALREKKSTV
jgi:predicted nucleic acid-binding protein